MNRSNGKILVVASLMCFSFFAGCKTQVSDSDAIRSGILMHLRSVGTLNIGAMNMDIRSVSINGTRAHAEVEFRPKTGAPPGAGMMVSYDLEKRQDGWVVLQTQAAGGMIDHPAPGQNPHLNPNVHSGAGVPNFSELVNPGAAPPSLPPGHPPVRSSSGIPPQAASRKPQ